ncbi:HEPN domain-containing protein [Planktothrix pseudagardhii]|uniref:HEPN domain-containing protein n=1 Tax=Planktothrix pseudagardhii TaxID=132604 RepID=UPI00349F0872
MNRQDFQDLAETRRKEAKVLLDNHQYSGAYYLSGYVIECALKACIAKKTRKYDFPDLKSVREIYNNRIQSPRLSSVGCRIPAFRRSEG